MMLHTLAIQVLALVKQALATEDEANATMALHGAFHGLLVNLQAHVEARTDAEMLRTGASDADTYRRALEATLADWTTTDAPTPAAWMADWVMEGLLADPSLRRPVLAWLRESRLRREASAMARDEPTH